ncbi:hypothetical protein [Nocardia sp. NPDC019255]|uniref:hypothetical protein n=1 Tax=Nocardia sp. NPDC019255 TaxID=3154591 RepID=UPI0033C8E272
MTKYDHGPLDTYEIVWESGHVEYIQAHQVITPPRDPMSAWLPGETWTKTRGGWTFHGEVDGRWRLLLAVRADEIRSVRNVTHTRDEIGGAS